MLNHSDCLDRLLAEPVIPTAPNLQTNLNVRPTTITQGEQEGIS